MADAAPRSPSKAKISHTQRNSQDDFNRRLRHLQRSDPVDPNELTRRLNAAIIEARFYKDRHGPRRRLANARDADNERSPSRSPIEAATPDRDVPHTTLNPFNRARSTLIFDTNRDGDDQISRVANALRALKDATAEQKEGEGQYRSESRTSGRSEHSERARSRRSTVLTIPKVEEAEETIQPQNRPHSVHPSPVIADAFKKRVLRKAPAPLILAAIPKAAKPAMVDVSSPITTKPSSSLPNLEPLSPFGATFSENGGSFLVYQPKEVRHDAPLTESPPALSPDEHQQEQFHMSNTSPKIPERKVPMDYFHKRRKSPPRLPAEAEQAPKQKTDSSNDAHGKSGERRQSRPNLRLSQSSETDGTDASEQAMSPIFELSQAQSSRTSLGQTTSKETGLKRMPSKRIGFTPEEFQDLGIAAAISQAIPRTPLEEVSPVSPLEEAADYFPAQEEQSVSPIASPRLEPMVLPKHLSSLPDEQQHERYSDRHSSIETPIKSATCESSSSDNTIRPHFADRIGRHDSTGFTVAREFLRDSVDSEHVRHVHTAANSTGEINTLQLPKLKTTISNSSRTEEIGDGIVLINSDSPILSKQVKLPVPANGQKREPSYTREYVASPDNSKHNSSADTPKSSHLSPAMDQFPRKDSADSAGSGPGQGLRRELSRIRRNTDATVTTLSSKPDFRARPLIQDANDSPLSPTPPSRPRTAAAKSSQPFDVPPLPTKLPNKIQFPPRANNAELGAMSPESLKLLHEQEALLRSRYNSILNPIDDALRKKPQAPVEVGPNGLLKSPKQHKHSRSRSTDASVAMSAAASTTNLELIQHQDNIAREQAAIRMQQRNLGSAARRPHAPFGNGEYTQSRVSMLDFSRGRMDMASPVGQTKSSFTFDDDTQFKRKRATWKFWKKR